MIFVIDKKTEKNKCMKKNHHDEISISEKKMWKTLWIILR